MPQATDLIIKNAAAADKTFTLIHPAAGDGAIAKWMLKEGAISAIFPTVTVSATETNNKSRQLRFKFRSPSSFNDSVTGLTNVASAAEVNMTVSIPSSYPEALKADFVAFTANLMNHSLVKAMVKDAYPAT